MPLHIGTLQPSASLVLEGLALSYDLCEHCTLMIHLTYISAGKHIHKIKMNKNKKIKFHSLKKYFLLPFQSSYFGQIPLLYCFNKCVANVVNLDNVLKYRMGFGARDTWVGSPAL